MTKQRLRRGFRVEAEEYAAEFRAELDLSASDPLSAYQLAAHLDVPVHKASQFEGITNAHRDFLAGSGNSLISATTLPLGTVRHILVNDYQHPNRQNSSVMHELAHILLGHPPHPPATEEGCRNFNPTAEYEANQLGFTLLVPKIAALRAVEDFAERQQAAEFFGVSVELLNHRIRISDAFGWAKNRARFRDR